MPMTVEQIKQEVRDRAYRHLGHRLGEDANGDVLELAAELTAKVVARLRKDQCRDLLVGHITAEILREEGTLRDDNEEEAGA
jgi:hypothetical protein